MWVKAPEGRARLTVMIYPLCQCGFIIQPHKVYRIIWYLFFHCAKTFSILSHHYLSGESSRCFLSSHESMAAQNAIPSAVSFLLIFSNINMQAALFDIFHYTFWHPRTKNTSAYVARTKYFLNFVFDACAVFSCCSAWFFPVDEKSVHGTEVRPNKAND